MSILKKNMANTDANDFNLEGIDMEVFKRPVTFAFTTRGNDIYFRLVTYLLQQHHAFVDMNVVTAASLWKPACSFLFEMVLETRFDFCHLMDSDVAPRKDTTARLMTNDLDIVSCPVWFYDGGTNSIHLNYHMDGRCLREYSPQPPEVGLQKVFATSFGCVLIKRRVLETFKQAGEDFTEWSELLPEEFKPAAPDTIFFAKCNALGFDVYMDWRCEFATHHKFVELNARTVETFVAHRIFDSEYGPEKKREMLQTEDGRKALSQRLQRGAAVGAD
jgi:hypothetical protein